MARHRARHPQESMQKRSLLIAAVVVAQLATSPLWAQMEIRGARASVELDPGAGTSGSSQ